MLRQPLYWLATHPKGALATLVTATVLLALAARDLGVRYEVEDFIPRETEEWATYQSYQKSFGRDDRTAVMLLESSRPIGLEEMQIIKALSQRVKSWPEVERVITPSNVLIPLRTTDGHVRLEQAFDPNAPDRLPAAFDKLRKRPYINTVLSKDRRLAVAAVTLHENRLSTADRTLLVRRLEQEKSIVESSGLFNVQLAGYPVHRIYFSEHIEKENRRLLPWALIVVVILLSLIFQNWGSVLAPLIGAFLSVIWTCGLMAAAGLSLNIFAPALFILVGLMAVSQAIHFLTGLQRKLREGLGTQASAKAILLEKSNPCGIASLTTAFVFAGLSLTGIPLIVDFGLAVALGAVSSWGVTILLLSPIATWVRQPHTGRLMESPLFWASWEDWLKQRKGAVLTCFAIVALVFAAGATRLHINSPLLADLSSDHPIRQANRLIEERLGGVIPLDVLIPSPGASPISAYTPERMQHVEALAETLRKLPGVISVSSPTDILHQLCPLLENVPPEDALMLLPTGLLLAPEQMQHWVDNPNRLMRIRIGMANLNTSESIALFDAINQAYSSVLGTPSQPILTGQGYLGQQLNRQLVSYFETSFWAGLILAVLIIALALRSVRLALASLLPNLFPLIVVAGVMGFVGIELRYTSALVLTVVFGLAVDDTIHVLSELRARQSSPDPMNAALECSGAGIVWTSVVLGGGFSVLLASTFVPNQVLGGLLALAAGAAVLADLVLLPALSHAIGLPQAVQRFDTGASETNPCPAKGPHLARAK